MRTRKAPWKCPSHTNELITRRLIAAKSAAAKCGNGFVPPNPSRYEGWLKSTTEPNRRPFRKSDESPRSYVAMTWTGSVDRAPGASNWYSELLGPFRRLRIRKTSASRSWPSVKPIGPRLKCLKRSSAAIHKWTPKSKIQELFPALNLFTFLGAFLFQKVAVWPVTCRSHEAWIFVFSYARQLKFGELMFRGRN